MRQIRGPAFFCVSMIMLLIGIWAVPELAVADDPILLQGTVTDRVTGLPMPNVSVLINSTSLSATTTDANGFYFLAASQLSQTTGTLYFLDAGYFVASTTYDVTAGAQTLTVRDIRSPERAGSISETQKDFDARNRKVQSKCPTPRL